MFDNTLHSANTTKLDRELFGDAITLVHNVWKRIGSHPHADHLWFNCHSISMAIAMCMPNLKCEHGFLSGLKGNEDRSAFTLSPTHHSWLRTPDDSIIDAYPVGFISCNPILVITKGGPSICGGEMYKKHQLTIDLHIKARAWRRAKILAELMR